MTPTRRSLYTLALLVGLGTILRLLTLDAQPLWLDEASTWDFARRTTLSSIIFSEPVHPPLHKLLLAGWMQLFGDTLFTLRLLPALFGIATIPTIYRCCTEALHLEKCLKQHSISKASDTPKTTKTSSNSSSNSFSSPTTSPTASSKPNWTPKAHLNLERWPWIVALLVAINPFLIAFSQEVRMYALLGLLGALLFWSLLRWLHRGRLRDALLLTLIGIAGLHTHYFFAFSFLGAAVTFLSLRGQIGWATGPPRKAWLLGAGIAATAGLSFLPWALYLLNNFQPITRANIGMVAAPAFLLLQHLSGVASIVIDALRIQQESLHPTEMIFAAFTLTIAALLTWSGTQHLRQTHFLWRLLLGALATPIGVLWLLVHPWSGLLRPHYLIATTPFLLALFALDISHTLQKVKASPESNFPPNTSLEPPHPSPPKEPSPQKKSPQARWTKHLGPLRLILFAAITLSGLFVYYASPLQVGDLELRYGKERWPEALAFIEDKASPGAVMILSPDYLSMPVNYYDRWTFPQVGVDDLSPTPNLELARALEEAGQPKEVWLVLSHLWDVDGYIDALLDAGWIPIHSLDLPTQWGIRVRGFQDPSR